MKKLLSILLVFSFLNSHSQAMYPYAFSKTTGNYQHLVGATSLTNGSLWSDTSLSAPICFPFKWALSNRTINTLEIVSRGYLFSMQDLDSNNDILMRMLMPYYAYLADLGSMNNTNPQSDIAYLCDGTAPNRIFKIEYKNCGLGLSSNTQDYTNFQVWLYEGSNIIEYRYGPQSIQDMFLSFYLTGSGPGINLLYDMSENNITQEIDVNNCSYVTGNATNATGIYSSTSFAIINPPAGFYFDGIPNNGQIFRWTPAVNPNSINSTADFNTIKVYPIPFNESIIIENKNEMQYIRICDLNGRMLLQEYIYGNNAELNTTSLSNGVYFMTIIDTRGNQKTIKVVK